MHNVTDIPIGLHKAILNSIPYGILVANKDGKFIFWNEVTYKTFKKELINSEQQNWVDDWGVFSVDKKTKYQTEEVPLSRALRGEIVTGEKLCISTEGRPCVFIKVSAFPIWTKEGEIEAGIVVFDDITKEQTMYDNILQKIGELENYLKNHLMTKDE